VLDNLRFGLLTSLESLDDAAYPYSSVQLGLLPGNVDTRNVTNVDRWGNMVRGVIRGGRSKGWFRRREVGVGTQMTSVGRREVRVWEARKPGDPSRGV